MACLWGRLGLACWCWLRGTPSYLGPWPSNLFSFACKSQDDLAVLATLGDAGEVVRILELKDRVNLRSSARRCQHARQARAAVRDSARQLSGRLPKFVDGFGSCGELKLWGGLFESVEQRWRSLRVNFHSNGWAICS